MCLHARLRSLGLTSAICLTAAPAAAIPLLSQTFTADAGQPAPAGITFSLLGPSAAGGGLLEGPILVDAPFTGALSISVTDLGLAGDVYEVLLDGASLGTTSAVRIGGPKPSAGVFTETVLGGFHQIDVWDFVQTYLFTTSPYGGEVTQQYFDSDVSVNVSLLPVPEPAALALLLPAALAALRLRRAG